LGQQLVEQLRSAIVEGSIPPGSRLPSSRALARECGVSRNLVVSAYDELFAEGYLEGVPGSGTYVRADLGSMLPATRHRPKPEVQAALVPSATELQDLRIDVGAVEPLSNKVWRRLWRGALKQPPPSRYSEPDGDPELRAAVAGYLHRARGVRCTADDVMITSGSLHAIDLVARASLGQRRSAAMENPGYPKARAVLARWGAAVLPIPVDADGLMVDQLPTREASPALVYVTPSHQFPLGGRLPIARRLRLLEWAGANDGIILEDDYDSEFRYGSPPLPALSALDANHSVAYVGTFSKTLSPAMRIGYLIAPRRIRDEIRQVRALSDWHTSWPVQRALAGFIAAGDYDVHIRRMRRVYGQRRAALKQVLESAPDAGTVGGIDAGLHAFWRLNPQVESSALTRAALNAGIRVSHAADFYFGGSAVNGVGIGYGAVDLVSLVEAASKLVVLTHSIP